MQRHPHEQVHIHTIKSTRKTLSVAFSGPSLKKRYCTDLPRLFLCMELEWRHGGQARCTTQLCPCMSLALALVSCDCSNCNRMLFVQSFTLIPAVRIRFARPHRTCSSANFFGHFAYTQTGRRRL